MQVSWIFLSNLCLSLKQFCETVHKIIITIPDVFLSLCLAMMVASLLETIVITNLLSGSTNYSPVPHWVRVLVLDLLGGLLRIPPKPKNLEDTVFKNPVAQGKIWDLGAFHAGKNIHAVMCSQSCHHLLPPLLQK